jgi:hypothetical protein
LHTTENSQRNFLAKFAQKIKLSLFYFCQGSSMRYWICLLFCSLTLTSFSQEVEEESIDPSSPEQIAALSSDTDFLIGGVISPLSGQPCLRQTDLVVKGAQDLTLNRVYIPPHIPCSFPWTDSDKKERRKRDKGEWEKIDFRWHLMQTYKGWQCLSHTKLRFCPIRMLARITDPSGLTLDFNLLGPNFSISTLASPAYAISNTSGDILYMICNTRVLLTLALRQFR